MNNRVKKRYIRWPTNSITTTNEQDLSKINVKFVTTT